MSNRVYSLMALQRAWWTFIFLPLTVFCCETNVAQEKNPFRSNQPGYPNWSAFTDVKFDGRKMKVQYDGKWYQLKSIHGKSVDSVFNFCKKNFSAKDAERRMAEDLVQVLRLMGGDIQKQTTIELIDGDGKIGQLDVEMTVANHLKLMRNRVGPRLRVRGARKLTPSELTGELELFQQRLASQFAYYKTNSVDIEQAIQQIAERFPNGIESSQLQRELSVVLAKFIDGHASVDGPWKPTGSYLPFLIEPSGDRFVAFKPDRSGFVDPQFPYVTEIDGVELKRWLASIDKFVSRGSPQFVRRQQLRLIRNLGDTRSQLGLADGGTVKITLSKVATQNKTITVDVGTARPVYGQWPRPVRRPGVLPNRNYGYLRLTSMNDRAAQLVRQWMPRFKKTDGLIIDVRDNGGGIRTPMYELARFLMSDKDPPRIANVCKYRDYDGFGPDHLSGSRFVYRRDSDQFGDRQRQAVDNFIRTFKPQWTPPADEFSRWHFAVLSKSPDDPGYDYKKHVVILMNEKCFSATDIFLGAFKGWPNVTLVGQPSSGGSARSEAFSLPHSGLRVRCASMASFQPNGLLYDTNGIQPDVVVVPKPEYFVSGGPDQFLETAIEILDSKN